MFVVKVALWLGIIAFAGPTVLIFIDIFLRCLGLIR
jgi:hypothetical protein